MNKTLGSTANKGSTQATAGVSQPTLIDHVLQSDYISYVRKVGLAVVVFFVLFMLSRMLATLASKKFYQHANISDLNKQESTGQLIYDIVFYILLIITIFIAFEIVGFDVGVILGGISFGVGFAFKEILGNMIAGVMILNIKELKLGDIIEIEGKSGYFGKIEEITIRYTIIRTLDLRQVVIPNMELMTNPIKTYSSEELIKLNTTIPVSYDQDLDKAMGIIIEAVNTMSIVHEKKNTKAYVIGYGPSGVQIKVFFRIDPNCGLPMEYIIGDTNATIAHALRDAGIKLPYKHITVVKE